MENHNQRSMGRREFLRRLGIGTGSAMALMAMEPLNALAQKDKKAVENRMTYRVQHGSGEQISLLGFGMMRLPNNQEQVNELVDYAIEHGVNYYDTAPMYMGGQSEVLMGNALSRHPREKYYVATKMSSQNRRLWAFDESKRMYEQSFERLKVDHIDYYLLHSIGGGMDSLKGRFLDNGVLEFLLKEREAGRIKHLGFSYHGDVRDFDWLLDHNDEYHWDFVQIQMNFLDWTHASMRGGRRSDADAEYLYNKCEKLGIQNVVMEPLRGGAFGRMAQELTDQLKAVHPDDSTARWAFRWVGSHPNILTTLSGMNRMDHPDVGCAHRALHSLRILHAVSLRCEYTWQLLLLQRGGEQSYPPIARAFCRRLCRAPAEVHRGLPQGSAQCRDLGPCLSGLRGVSLQVSAADSHPQPTEPHRPDPPRPESIKGITGSLSLQCQIKTNNEKTNHPHHSPCPHRDGRTGTESGCMGEAIGLEYLRL